MVGTKGRTTVSGTTLQHIFGLLTTYEVFATITTLPGRAPGQPSSRSPAPGPAATTPPHGLADTRAVVALVPLVNAMVANAVPGIHGNVFAAPRHATIAIQVGDHGRWRTVSHAALAKDGSYSVQLPVAGSYRVVYRGLNGPPVKVTA